MVSSDINLTLRKLKSKAKEIVIGKPTINPAERPLEIGTLLCLIIAILLLTIALCSTSWLKTGLFHTGFFQECTSPNEPIHAAPFPDAPPRGHCQKSRGNGVFAVTAFLLIMALACTVISTYFHFVGLCQLYFRNKVSWYQKALKLCGFTILIEIIALVMFPYAFFYIIEEYGTGRVWNVDWAFGVAWGATFSTTAASLMLWTLEDLYY